MEQTRKYASRLPGPGNLVVGHPGMGISQKPPFRLVPGNPSHSKTGVREEQDGDHARRKRWEKGLGPFDLGKGYVFRRIALNTNWGGKTAQAGNHHAQTR